jgi:predicted secreted Zn-dependent protease
VGAQSYAAMWVEGERTGEVGAKGECSVKVEWVLSVNESDRRQIASLTKIMTAYTVLSLCQEYNIKVREQWIPIHTRASYMEGTSANLRSG